MPSWSEIRDKLLELSPESKAKYLNDLRSKTLNDLSEHSQRNIIFYASGFLQKPFAPAQLIGLDREDLTGMMVGVHQHNPDRELLLILHTPGGMVEAAESVVGYLREKYSKVDAVVPMYAMSAGTMVALACDRIHMGRQSQLGPTDPQLAVGAGWHSAHSIIVQFEEAKKDISSKPILTNVWTPILQAYGPALLEKARRSIEYGNLLIEKWLKQYMFSEHMDREELARKAASYFGGKIHGSHGRRIDRDDARQYGIEISSIEDDQKFQDLVLTLLHLSTHLFQNTSLVKFVMSSNGKIWDKHFNPDRVGS